MKILSVFCSSKNNLNKKYELSVKKFIDKLNKDSYTIAYGGGTTGLMGVVRNEWVKKGGTIISSNIHKFVDPNVEDTYVFDNIIDRQKKLVELGDGYVILPGGYGTHYEMLEVITKNDIKEANKPIFIYNIDNVFENFILQFEYLTKEGFVSHNFNDLNIHISKNEFELIEQINKYGK